jgi:uncharacterized protein (DUF1800 family)
MLQATEFNCSKAIKLLIGVLVFTLSGCGQNPKVISDSSSLVLNEPQITPSNRPAAQWRAINRLNYGPTTASLAAVQAAPSPVQWALAQLDAARVASQSAPKVPADMASINSSLPALFEGAQKERQSRAAVAAGTPINDAQPFNERFNFNVEPDPLYFNRTQVNKAVAWRLASCSNDEIEQPLLARMTEFWFNHFNIYQQKGTVRPFAGHYAIHVARAHALGKFEDLLMASAKHPAMLYYLDQWLSVSPQTNRTGQVVRGLNENYARELMELHTLGVQGGYSQNDVKELAKILTGWTISAKSDDGFQFVPRLHESGQKTLLGQAIPSSPRFIGEGEGVQALQLLARHPATAKRISQRLAEYFVADMPPPELVQHLTKVFINTEGDIYQVMSALIRSEAFWNSEQRLYRTPYDFVCGSLRLMQAGNDRAKWLQGVGYTFAAGQTIQNWQTPDGYSFDAATWMSPEALTRRIDFAFGIARNSREPLEVYPFLSESSLKAVYKQTPAQRMGFVLGSPEFIYK